MDKGESNVFELAVLCIHGNHKRSGWNETQREEIERSR